MGISDVLSLVAGLSLFLLGMNSMSDGLEAAAGNKMKGILEKLTSNRFIGVIVGALITAVIQSSSATTVMVVGFVNAGMMTLSQAVWVIMGANIGTTITGLLISLDIGLIAPIFAIAGVIMMVFIKKPLVNEIGKILAGFGILFIGMDMMSASMMPLRESKEFVNILASFENPILGILVGALFTAIIQSSSASIGILQALAVSGAINLSQAVYVLFGQNIGTCITSLIASLSTNRSAKRATLIHLFFNVIGTVLFTVICATTPFVSLVEGISTKVPQQIASMHIIFNIATTLILIPFGLYLVKLAEKILPDVEEKHTSIFMYLDHEMNLNVGGTAVHIQNTKKELYRMYEIASNSIASSFKGLLGEKDYDFKKIEEDEELVDKLHEGITKQVTHCLTQESNITVSNIYSAFLHLSTNIERLSDHAMNLAEAAEEMKAKGLEFNDIVREELKIMEKVSLDILRETISGQTNNAVQELEDLTDKMAVDYKANMVERLKTGVCHAEGAIIYSTILVDFERIGDHLLNVREAFDKIEN